MLIKVFLIKKRVIWFRRQSMMFHLLLYFFHSYCCYPIAVCCYNKGIKIILKEIKSVFSLNSFSAYNGMLKQIFDSLIFEIIIAACVENSSLLKKLCFGCLQLEPFPLKKTVIFIKNKTSRKAWKTVLNAVLRFSSFLYFTGSNCVDLFHHDNISDISDFTFKKHCVAFSGYLCRLWCDCIFFFCLLTYF